MALNRGGGVLRRTGETREPSEQLQKRGCPGAAKARVASKAKKSLASRRESHGRISTALEEEEEALILWKDLRVRKGRERGRGWIDGRSQETRG